MMLWDLAYPHHLPDAILSIEEFSSDISSAEDLSGLILKRAAIERMIPIIGEAAKNISPNEKRSILIFPGKRLQGCVIKLFTPPLVSIMKQYSSLFGMKSQIKSSDTEYYFVARIK